MNTPGAYSYVFKNNINDEREDIVKQFIHNNSKTRIMKRRFQMNSRSLQSHSNFSRLNQVKLNKGKKFLLEEQRNTEIERSNRILHEKITRCARKSQPNTLKSSQINSINSIQYQKIRATSKPKKIKTNPTLPTLENQRQAHHVSRAKSKDRKSSITLFMGHSYIDDVQFKIKVIITEGVYYLIAKNQHTRIVLEMPEEQYWHLHYKQFQENPCNIFKFLQIQKGQIKFRVKQRQKSKKKKKQKKVGNLQQNTNMDLAQFMPKGVSKQKEDNIRTKSSRLPKI